MAEFENAVVPVVLAAERQVAQLTNSYLTTMSNLGTGSNARPAPLDTREVTGAALRNGVEPSTVYRRPESTVNAALADGASVTAAVTQGLNRALVMARSDLQLAKTHTVARQGKSKWYRRSLTGAENCAMCVIASTQRYHRGDLMPIHGGCDCAVQEETSMDPGQIIDAEKLETVHAAIEAEFGGTDRGARYLDGLNERSDYLDLIVTREHGELGPTLAWRDQHFTGPQRFVV
ncbi:MAG: hypothetical protein ABWX62_08645 [Microterricola sp.]